VLEIDLHVRRSYAVGDCVRARAPPTLAWAIWLVFVAEAALVGIGDRIVSGDKHPTPFHGTWDLAADNPGWAAALLLGGAGIALAALLGSRRRRAPAPEG
jgi:hypothetical protein